MRPYKEFLRSKTRAHKPQGFEIDLSALNPESFGERHQFQPHVIQWGLRLGRAALFAKYGTGKTRMQLEWANQVALKTGGNWPERTVPNGISALCSLM